MHPQHPFTDKTERLALLVHTIIYNVLSYAELEPGLESALFIKMKYPQLSQGQIARRHVPETVSVVLFLSVIWYECVRVDGWQ